MTIAAHIENFLHYIRYEKRMSEKTQVAYRKDLEQFSAYLDAVYPDIGLQDLELNHMRSWMVYLTTDGKLQARSLQRKSSALKSFFKDLMRLGHIKMNPARLLRTPKQPKRLPAFLESEQTEDLLQSVQKGSGDDLKAFTDYLIIEILYQTGMRRAELAGLKEPDVEASRNLVRVLGKRNKERLIPINTFLLRDIEEYVSLKRKIFAEPTDKLLTLKSGKGLYDKYIYKVVNRSLQPVSTLNKKSPHVMRHTFATQIMNNGANVNAVKELLGHSSLASTQIYTHTNIEKLKEVYRKAHPKS